MPEPQPEPEPVAEVEVGASAAATIAAQQRTIAALEAQLRGAGLLPCTALSHLQPAAPAAAVAAAAAAAAADAAETAAGGAGDTALCSQCGSEKPRTEFRQTQLRKRQRRRCRACVDAGPRPGHPPEPEPEPEPAPPLAPPPLTAAEIAAAPPLEHAFVQGVVEEYGAAWMAQDEERITRIFAEGALYLEHPFDPRRIYRGRVRAQSCCSQSLLAAPGPAGPAGAGRRGGAKSAVRQLGSIDGVGIASDCGGRVCLGWDP